MMKQYREARESLEDDTLAAFPSGRFLRDVRKRCRKGAALLGITLTKRHDMPMAGIPSHAAEGYLTKLLNLGNKVALVINSSHRLRENWSSVGLPVSLPRNRLGGWSAGWIQ